MQTLPERINPRKWADQNLDYQVVVGVAPLDRLAAAVVRLGDELQIDLHFYRDEEGRRRITGKVACPIELVCQRCLELIDIPLRADVDLAIVSGDEQAKALPRDLEAWIVEDDSASLAEMVEDELILALPVVALHPQDVCQGSAHFETEKIEISSDKPNPFAALAALKGK